MDYILLGLVFGTFGYCLFALCWPGYLDAQAEKLLRKHPDRMILDVPWATRDKPMMSARTVAALRRSHDRRMAQANDQFEQFRTSLIQTQLDTEKSKQRLAEAEEIGNRKRSRTNRNMS